MYINITDSDTGNNKGSSGALVHYLDKENRLFAEMLPEQWFNGTANNVPSHEVRRSLDDNIAKLMREDAKFFLINISPSQKEIAFLKEQYGNDAKTQLKAYAVKVMDEYAQNFNRPGIESNEDLLWFAKLENHRYYSHKDKEVRSGLKKRGEIKPGEQMHIQVIVSRKDITNKIKLSPMNKSRGKNVEHSKKLGQFDRSQFANSGEKLFDQAFGFDRKLEETFEYAKTQKKGNLKERMAMRENANKEQRQQQSQRKQNRQRSQTKEKAQGQESYLRREPQTHYLEKEQPAKTYLPTPEQTNYLAIALGKTGPDVAPSVSRKKKRRKSREQEQGLTL